jgi:peptidyl-prolyl cis-trans isomerase SurA
MKKLLFAALTLAVAVAPVARPSAQSPGQGRIVQKVIVKVNGEIFTLTELEFRQVMALREMDQQVRNAADLNTNAGLQKALNQVTPGLLVEAVDELILVQRGRELGVKFTDADFKAALTNLREANPSIKDDAQLEAALKSEGYTLEELRVNFERSRIIQVVQQQDILKNVTITEEESRQYYKAHPEEFIKPSTVTVREISINVPTDTVGGQATVNVAADEAARATIMAVRERAQKGEDFVALVAEVSESGTKANGGLIGPVNTADLAPAAAAMIEKLSVGEVGQPLRTRTGYQLIKLDSRTTAEPEAFESVGDKIAQKILEERLEVEKDKFLTRMRGQALIEWKDEQYRKMFEAEMTARAKGGLQP